MLLDVEVARTGIRAALNSKTRLELTGRVENLSKTCEKLDDSV